MKRQVMSTLGERVHLVRLQNPSPAAPDGDGSFTQTWTDLDPAELYVAMAPATAREMERISNGTVLSQASHLLSSAYHPGIRTKSRILFGDRIFSVLGVVDPEERHRETILFVSEVVA